MEGYRVPTVGQNITLQIQERGLETVSRTETTVYTRIRVAFPGYPGPG
jgi:hypothetical protein